jgi:hypothetical protein
VTPRAAARALLFGVLAALLAPTADVLPASAQQPRATAQVVPGVVYLADIWCAPDGSCLAVGSTYQNVGAVVAVTAAGSIGPVRPVPGTDRLSGIDCPASGSCIATGRGVSGGIAGVVLEVSRDGTPGPSRPVSGSSELGSVACPTATTCLATGALHVFPPGSAHGVTTPIFTVVTNGQPAPARDFPRARVPYGVFGIDCPTTTRCLAVSPGAIVVLSDVGGTWLTTLMRVPAEPGRGYPTLQVSCATPTTCYATASGAVQTPEGWYGIPGMVPVSADGVTGPVQVLSDQGGISNDISCIFGRSCTVVGQEHTTSRGISIDVFRGTTGPVVIWENVNLFTGVSCIAPGACGMVGIRYPNALFAWHGRVPV